MLFSLSLSFDAVPHNAYCMFYLGGVKAIVLIREKHPVCENMVTSGYVDTIITHIRTGCGCAVGGEGLIQKWSCCI